MNNMGSDRYLSLLPLILGWMQQTLDAHAGNRRPVSSFNFPRLSSYFSQDLLKSAGVVVASKVPVPPLAALGLVEFAAFETQPVDGITYQDTYFVRTSASISESLHLHELVHVVQWRTLGPRDFLLLYAAGLAQCGYLECPLETMAYRHQRRFETEEPPYGIEAEVRAETLALKSTVCRDAPDINQRRIGL